MTRPANFSQAQWQGNETSATLPGFPPDRGPSLYWNTAMPKTGKTHKGLAKRFKVTATGKVKHRKANRGHLMGKKSGNRKRRLRQDGVRTGFNAVYIVEALRPSS